MAKNKYERQMAAVIGKLLSDLEEVDGIRELHPFTFDKIRRRCISAAWECYLVGRNKGLQEIDDADTTEFRAVSG